MTVLIDNYDSFTYNLVQAIESLGIDVRVFRNDKIDVKGIEALKPDYLVISPGPGNPDTAGVSLAAVKAFAGKVPILGVCLGHQTIAQRADRPREVAYARQDESHTPRREGRVRGAPPGVRGDALPFARR